MKKVLQQWQSYLWWRPQSVGALHSEGKPASQKLGIQWTCLLIFRAVCFFNRLLFYLCLFNWTKSESPDFQSEEQFHCLWEIFTERPWQQALFHLLTSTVLSFERKNIFKIIFFPPFSTTLHFSDLAFFSSFFFHFLFFREKRSRRKVLLCFLNWTACFGSHLAVLCCYLKPVKKFFFSVKSALFFGMFIPGRLEQC